MKNWQDWLIRIWHQFSALRPLFWSSLDILKGCCCFLLSYVLLPWSEKHISIWLSTTQPPTLGVLLQQKTDQTNRRFFFSLNLKTPGVFFDWLCRHVRHDQSEQCWFQFHFGVGGAQNLSFGGGEPTCPLQKWGFNKGNQWLIVNSHNC